MIDLRSWREVSFDWVNRSGRLRVAGYFLLAATLPLVLFPWGRIMFPTGHRLFLPTLIAATLAGLGILARLWRRQVRFDWVVLPALLLLLGTLAGALANPGTARSLELVVRLALLMMLAGSIAWLAPSHRAVRITIVYLVSVVGILVVVELIGCWQDPVRILNVMRGLRLQNATAFMLLVLIPFPLAAMVSGSRTLNRVVNMGMAILLIVGLFYTYSRSGILSLGLGAVTMFLLVPRSRRKAAWMLAAVLVVSGCLVWLGPRALRSRLLSTVDLTGEAHQSSNPARLVLLRIGLRIAADRPLLGIGPGRFPDVMHEYLEPGQSEQLGWPSYAHAHNQYLDAWHDGGILAVAGLVWLLVMVMARLRKNAMDASRPDDPMPVAALLAFCGAIWFGLAETPMDLELFWIILGLSLAVIRLSGPKKLPAAHLGVGQQECEQEFRTDCQ